MPDPTLIRLTGPVASAVFGILYKQGLRLGGPEWFKYAPLHAHKEGIDLKDVTWNQGWATVGRISSRDAKKIGQALLEILASPMWLQALESALPGESYRAGMTVSETIEIISQLATLFMSGPIEVTHSHEGDYESEFRLARTGFERQFN